MGQQYMDLLDDGKGMGSFIVDSGNRSLSSETLVALGASLTSNGESYQNKIIGVLLNAIPVIPLHSNNSLAD